MKCKGDNDPVDVVEIGSKALATGSVTQVDSVNVSPSLEALLEKHDTLSPPVSRT